MHIKSIPRNNLLNGSKYGYTLSISIYFVRFSKVKAFPSFLRIATP